ncbi:MAG: hypothetical protein AB7G39_06330 [Alphaproteobacteria bacterium]
MRPIVCPLVSVGAATSLVATCGGTLILFAHYFLFKFGAALLETIGILGSGWAIGHALLLMEIAAGIAAPVILAISVWFFRSALQVERSMAVLPPL